MHPDLELIASADEEARARVALAEQRRQSEITLVRAKHDSAIDARRREAMEALERELRTIREDGHGRVAGLQRQQAQYLTMLAEEGQREFEKAVALYLRIICEVSS